MSVQVHGISNCDTVKKARAFLAEQGVAHEFHDYGKQGLTPATLDRWLSALGWEALLNRKGTTWRKLDEALRDSVGDVASARGVMLQHLSVIKRPVVEWDDGRISVGFSADDWRRRV